MNEEDPELETPSEGDGAEEETQLVKDLTDAMKLANDGDMEEAVAIAKQAIADDPEAAEPYFVLSAIAYRYGDQGQAIAMAETAHNLSPDTAEYADMLATLSMQVGRLTDGVYYAKVAMAGESNPFVKRFMPQDLDDLKTAMEKTAPSRHGVEGARLFNTGDYQRALIEFSAELRINPENADALKGQANAAILVGNFQQAVGASQAYLRLNPDDPMALATLSRALLRVGRSDDASAVARRAISLAAGNAEVYVAAMDTLQLCPQMEEDTLKDIATKFFADFDEEHEPDPIPDDEHDAGLPVHIGMLSNAFFRTIGAEVFEGWFDVPANSGCMVSGYQQSIAVDAVTTTIKNGCNDWREIYDIDPFTLSMVMRSENLDVLVDISETGLETRAAVTGLQPCPVRVGATILPMPGLAPGVTHVLSDETTAPADQQMLLPGQEVIEISTSLYARKPYVALSQTAECLAEERGFVTFGTVGLLPFMSLECAFAFGEILRALPDSELMVLRTNDVSDDVAGTVREYFVHAGVGERVKFVQGDIENDEDDGESEFSFDRLEARIPSSHWREIDILLDTFPLNLRAETCEALWSGVPTVTRRDTRRPGRVGASILAAAGRPNWVASSTEEFVKIATGLAADLPALVEESRKLKELIGSSDLFDHRKTARAIRDALINTARRARESG